MPNVTPPLLRALALAGGLAAGQAGAADFTVTRLDDPAPDACLPGDCSLREAVRAANLAPGADRVLLAGSPMPYALTRPGPLEDAALTGDLDVTDTLDVVGATAATSVISQLAADRVFHVLPNVRLGLLRVTVASGEGVTQGAGVYVPSGSLQIVESVLQDNVASDRGGGVYLRSPTSNLSLDVQRSRFIENDAGIGGGVHVAGTTNVPTTVRLDFAEFLSNDSVQRGGGLSLEGDLAPGSTVLVNRVTFVENRATAALGGGGAIANATPASTVVDVRDSAFLGNRATGNEGRGGALLDVQQVRNSRFSQNSAAYGGASWGSVLRAENSTFCDNAADHQGGAIVAVDVHVLRSTLCRNQILGTDIADGGGALFLEDTLAVAVIERSTFDANVAAYGAAMLLRDGDLHVAQSTLTEPVPAVPGTTGSLIRYEGQPDADLVELLGNVMHGDCSFPQGGVVDRAEYNLIAPADTCGFGPVDPAHFGNFVASSTAEIPLLALTDNGGPTQTRAPTDSVVNPVFDWLPQSACLLALDQRGYVRFDQVCDAGAFEGAAAPPVSTSLFANGFEG